MDSDEFRDDEDMKNLSEKSYLVTLKQATIEYERGMRIAFSSNGKYFAYFIKKEVRIFKLRNPTPGVKEEIGKHKLELLIKDVDEDRFKYIFDDAEALRSTTDIYFDLKNRFLLCYGRTGASVITLQFTPENRTRFE